MLYKLTFFDANCPSCFSGTVSFFSEDIEQFERLFFLNGDEFMQEKRQRFLKSKAGELVVDFYNDDPELNMVQWDENAELTDETQIRYHQKDFVLENSYGCEVPIYAEDAVITIAQTKFKGKYYQLAKYELTGVCQVGLSPSDEYENLYVWGNPIFIQKRTVFPEQEDPDAWSVRWYYPKEQFLDSSVKTFCWVVLDYGDEPFPTKTALTDEEIIRLMRDIPGEAG